MVKVEIYRNPPKEALEFPKLMIGRNTGTIYLAIGKSDTNWGSRIKTIVLESRGGNNEKIGTASVYLANLLEDFDGSITLRNE